MDWLWPLYAEHVGRLADDSGDQSVLQEHFIASLLRSTATLYIMEPIGDTIRFKGLGQWLLSEVPDLLSDPHAFIADRFGGGKFKINFHDRLTFVGTHNFRTYGDELWRDIDEVFFD